MEKMPLPIINKNNFAIFTTGSGESQKTTLHDASRYLF